MSIKDTTIPEMRLSKTRGQMIIRSWIRDKKTKPFTTTVRPGNFVFIRSYVATTVKTWDKNPVILVLGVSKSYVLGFNINWLNRIDRERVIRFFIKQLSTIKKPRPTRLQRLAMFNKLKRHPYPRYAYRVYFSSEIRNSRLYPLSFGDFFAAMTADLSDVVNMEKRSI